MNNSQDTKNSQPAQALDKLFEVENELGLHYDEKPEQEPVATVTSETGADITMSWWHEPALPIGTKLYTTPPKREWVGLTDEEWQIFADTLGCFITRKQKDIIEAKLKEKNS